MTLKDDIRRFDEEERAAIVKAYLEHPERPIEEINAQVADLFRERWRSMISGDAGQADTTVESARNALGTSALKPPRKQ